MSDVQVRADESYVVGADGTTLREYDDVIVLRQLVPDSAGNVSPDVIKAGTRATIILIDEGVAHLECYVGPRQFAFAHDAGAHLRLWRSREEKKSNA